MTTMSRPLLGIVDDGLQRNPRRVAFSNGIRSDVNGGSNSFAASAKLERIAAYAGMTTALSKGWPKQGAKAVLW